MIKIIYLELKAIFREYKQSQQLSFHEILFVLALLMTFTFGFFLLNKLDINLYIILNLLTLMVALLAISLKKDHFYDYIKTSKLYQLKIFPRNQVFYAFLKGIKYDVIFCLELFIILLLVFIPIALGGFSIVSAFPYILFAFFLFMCMRNFSLIITSIRVSPIWQYVSIFIQSLFLSGIFIGTSYAVHWFSNFEGNIQTIFNQIQEWSIIKVIGEIARQNFINTDFIIIAFISMILSYLLKIIVYLFYVAQSREAVGDKFIPFIISFFQKKMMKRNSIMNKEYQLLAHKNILQYIIKRVFIYVLAAVVITFFQLIFKQTLSLPVYLIYMFITTEVLSLVNRLIKSSTGYEKKYIIHYILSGFKISDLVIIKSKLISLLLCIAVIPIHLSLSIIFNVHWVQSLYLIPMYITFIIMFSFASSYFFTSKTSYDTDLAIPHKYASIKIIGVSSAVIYFDLILIIFMDSLITSHLSGLFITFSVMIIHLSCTALFFSKIKKGWRKLYGEYSNAII